MNNPQRPTPPPSPPDADPLIDEVREARRRIDAEHGGDIRALVAALRTRQEQSGRRIITDRGPSPKQAG